MARVDVEETFASVIKPSTIRVVLSIVVSKGWNLWQLDILNTFLHGILQEDVFMLQPSRFHDEKHPNHIYRLKKSLYGLKQFPRDWFKRLRDFILQVGFTKGLFDSSLFINNRDEICTYLLIYVDNIVVTSSSNSNIEHIVSKLVAEFLIKDLGSLTFFLGIHVVQSEEGLFLS